MEEKILEMLQKMDNRMVDLQNEMKCTRKELTERIDAVDAKVTKVQVIIETELRPNISLLAEGYGPLISDIKTVREIVEVMEPRLEIVEKVVRRNSKRIDIIEQTIYAS